MKTLAKSNDLEQFRKYSIRNRYNKSSYKSERRCADGITHLNGLFRKEIETKN
jgi:hypothetical protein